MYACVGGGYMYECIAWRVQKVASDPLNKSYSQLWSAWYGYWELNSGSSGRTVCILNQWAISLAYIIFYSLINYKIGVNYLKMHEVILLSIQRDI